MAFVMIVSTDHLATVAFAYNEALVELIRTVPGRKWHVEDRVWTVPAGQIEGTAAMFHKAGCTVTIDGKVWTPLAQHKGSVPSSRVELLTRLFTSIPDRLGPPTQRALIRVWHPDAGGDDTLARDLNQVWSRSPKGTT